MFVSAGNGWRWEVLRRYSAFAAIHATPTDNSITISDKPPALPPKRGLRRLWESRGEKRAQLRNFVTRLVEVDSMAEADALRLFLGLPQSARSMNSKSTIGSISEVENENEH